MIAPIVFGILVVIFFLLGIGVGMRPNIVRYERSLDMNVPPQAVFPLVNDFTQWRQWSPWEEKDPNMERNYAVPAAGVGASYSWSGDKNVGAGRMTITESVANEYIVLKLEFLRPMVATHETRFTFTPTPAGTKVNWSMTGKNHFISKLFSLFIDFDKMIGADFEKGLASMNAAAQNARIA